MHTFKQFCSLVNGLARGHCDDLNVLAADAGSPFRASHVEYPPAMLAHYFERGLDSDADRRGNHRRCRRVAAGTNEHTNANESGPINAHPGLAKK